MFPLARCGKRRYTGVYLKTHDVTGSEGFLRCARHFFAGILTYFKENDAAHRKKARCPGALGVFRYTLGGNAMYCILVAGMPASGKSTIAVRISESLGIPMLSKDSIKEVLFDDLGFHSRAEKVQLGTAAMHILYYAAAQLMKVGKPFILENNFEDASIPGIMALLETHHYTAVTVRLTGDPEVIYRRFAARDLSDTRHRGHVVNDCYPEPPGAPLETPTRKSYEQFLDDIAARGYTRFQANGPVLEVDVTDLSELDFPRLMGSLTGFVQRAVPGYPLRLPTRNAQSHRK